MHMQNSNHQEKVYHIMHDKEMTKITLIESKEANGILPLRKGQSSLIRDNEGLKSISSHSKNVETRKREECRHESSLATNKSDFLIETDKIGLLISKGKKAAKSLWTILHAQECKHKACSHKGCYETKRILLHIKTCNSVGSCKCPQDYLGCQETRKLLAHYRRCRSSRQRATLNRGSNYRNPCLICSFLAQHAKMYVENKKARSEMVHSSSFDKINYLGKEKAVCRTVHSSSLGKINETDDTMPPPPPRLPTFKSRSFNGNISYNNLNICMDSLNNKSQIGQPRKRSASLDLKSPTSKSQNDPTLEKLTQEFNRLQRKVKMIRH